MNGNYHENSFTLSTVQKLQRAKVRENLQRCQWRAASGFVLQ